MFGNLFMSVNSKLKKIIDKLGTNAEKLDEVRENVAAVGTDVANVQVVSDEIKALIGTEIATQLSALESNVIAAMPGGSSGLTSCVKSMQNISASNSATNYSGNVNESYMDTTITFSAVDLNKTFVNSSGCVLSALTSTSAIVTIPKTEETVSSDTYRATYGPVIIQVIEYN